jgi:hypothetical protein
MRVACLLGLVGDLLVNLTLMGGSVTLKRPDMDAGKDALRGLYQEFIVLGSASGESFTDFWLTS